jgi:hypothetical protein
MLEQFSFRRAFLCSEAIFNFSEISVALTKEFAKEDTLHYSKYG